jgi:hypothetical protein
VSPFLLVVGVCAVWLLIATLLALGLGRAVAVARAHEQHDPPQVSVARGSLAGRTTTAVLHRVSIARSR